MITLTAIRFLETPSQIQPGSSVARPANQITTEPVRTGSDSPQDRVLLSSSNSSATSSDARWLDVPGLGRVDVSKLPVELPMAGPFFGEQAVKASMKNDWLSHGVYVDDAFVDAAYAAVADINTPPGPIPNIPFPKRPG